MFNKKIACIGLVAAMLIGVAGCGTGDTETQPAAGGETASAESSLPVQSPEEGEAVADTVIVNDGHLVLKCEYTDAGESVRATVLPDSGDAGAFTVRWLADGTDTGVTGEVYTAGARETERLLTAEATDGNVTYQSYVYLSSLPVLYLTTGDGTVGEWDYTDAYLRMQGGLNAPCTEEESYEGDIQIKLRGNSTRWRDKKPYKIKLGKKADLFGMGKSKHWTLLANDIDHTLSRNKIVMDFAYDIGLTESCRSVNTVLILDGEYMGVYQLCEHIRVGGDQVDITDWEDLAEDAAKGLAGEVGLSKEQQDALEDSLVKNLDWLCGDHIIRYDGKDYDLSVYVDIPERTGGFLLEMDFYHFGDRESVITNFGQPFYFNTPENAHTAPELFEYARTYIQTFEYAIHSDDFVYHESDPHYRAQPGTFTWGKGWSETLYEVEYTDPERDGMSYTELFDLDNLVAYFLVCEFSRNWDSMKNSVFLYKEVGEKAKMGPVWDYDWAFGNRNMYWINTYFSTGWQTTDYYFSNEQYYQDQNWYRYLIKDPVFVQAVYDKWQEIRPTVIEEMIRDGGTLSQMRNELLAAGRANDMRWEYTYDEYNSVGYDKSWSEMEQFIRDRIEWLDAQFADYDTLYESLNSYEQAKW